MLSLFLFSLVVALDLNYEITYGPTTFTCIDKVPCFDSNVKYHFIQGGKVYLEIWGFEPDTLAPKGILMDPITHYSHLLRVESFTNQDPFRLVLEIPSSVPVGPIDLLLDGFAKRTRIYINSNGTEFPIQSNQLGGNNASKWTIIFALLVLGLALFLMIFGLIYKNEFILIPNEPEII
jgi:hypothetical protein